MTTKTFAERCTLSEQCLPDAPYRAMLTKLHVEMLAEIERLSAIEEAAKNLVKVKGRYHTEQAFNKLKELVQ